MGGAKVRRSDLTLAGRAFIEEGHRPVFNAREIRRGKSKGMVEVIYRSSATLWRKAILKKDDIRRIQNGDE